MFRDFEQKNNIAILEMAEPVPLDQYPNIKPVCLPDPGADFTGSTATVTGWGLDNRRGGSYNSWLHEVQVTVLDDEYCAGITSSELCAGVLEGDEAPCDQDDGGPLVLSDDDNNQGLTLVGIIFYDDCRFAETYVKVPLFSDWINEIIGDSETCPPPPPASNDFL